MNNSKSCTIALPRECNYATQPLINATLNATNHTTEDLIALSTKVLERNQHNQVRNLHATQQLHQGEISATKFEPNATQLWHQKSELKHLIKTVGKYYKATDEEIVEMFEDTLDYHSIEVALATFRALKKQIVRMADQN